MDTELARTFLTVVNAGSFITAAERLHVSQSTVSTRIRTLEEQLGARLFVRNKGGAQMTSEGRRFQRHAATLVRTVEAARHDLGMPPSFEGSVTVGGRFGLWEQLLLTWLPWFRAAYPNVAVRAQVGFEEDLMQGLAEGEIDAALMYTPQSRPGLAVEPLFDEHLVLVGSSPRGASPADDDYIFVDWGASFRAGHSVSFPDFTGAAITASIGWLGLQTLLEHGGSGYFPLRLVRAQVESGRLHLQRRAPEFGLTAYLVYPRNRENEPLDRALAGIRAVAKDFVRGGVSAPDPHR